MGGKDGQFLSFLLASEKVERWPRWPQLTPTFWPGRGELSLRVIHTHYGLKTQLCSLLCRFLARFNTIMEAKIPVSVVGHKHSLSDLPFYFLIDDQQHDTIEVKGFTLWHEKKIKSAAIRIINLEGCCASKAKHAPMHLQSKVVPELCLSCRLLFIQTTCIFKNWVPFSSKAGICFC